MEYTLLKTILSNCLFSYNEDGSLNVSNTIVQIGIVGSPAGKFIQTDTMPPFNVPKSTTTGNIPAYINEVAQEYVEENYPNT